MKTKIAKIYDQRSKIPFDGSTYYEQVKMDSKFVFDAFPDKKLALCDIGCGYGYHLEELHKNGYSNLTGIDISYKSIKICKKRLSSFYPEIDLKCVDIFEWDKYNDFNGAFAFLACVGEYGVEKDIRFFSSVKNILKTSSFFLFSMFSEEVIDNITGSVLSSYTESKEYFVNSSITYDSQNKYLFIEQNYHNNNEVVNIDTEIIKIYSEEEICSFGLKSGFNKIELIKRTNSASYFLAY